MRMGLGAMFERLKQHIYSKPSNSVSNSQSISENFTSYEPTLFFNMGCGDEESYVDVEYISVQQFVRVSGVNFNMHCIDFLVRLCCYLGLRPGDYTFLVPSESLSGVSPICWRCVPPSSKLGSWVNSNTTLTKFPPMVRLIAKCCLKRSAKLYQYPFLDTEFKHPIIPTKTGREFLADLGYRIIVHLPENRKIVVRGQLDQPIMNVLQEVSTIDLTFIFVNLKQLADTRL
ncbi:unnamed protein product [Trichobilharzia regenti]|nr:unnamed protein product [Trichobilharzia regenti]